MFVHAFNERGCRNCMVVGFKTTYIQSVPITINVVSSNPTQCEVYSIQHYAKKFVCEYLADVHDIHTSYYLHINAISEFISATIANLKYFANHILINL